jgi:cytochrome b
VREGQERRGVIHCLALLATAQHCLTQHYCCRHSRSPLFKLHSPLFKLHSPLFKLHVSGCLLHAVSLVHMNVPALLLDVPISTARLQTDVD